MKNFLGYVRPNEKVGIRNLVLILSTSGLSNPIVMRLNNMIKGTVPVLTPNGRGQVGRDKEQFERTLIGLAGNPNIAATLIIGYDKQTVEYFESKVGKFGKPVSVLSIFEEQGTINATEKGMRILMDMVIEASNLKRSSISASELTFGLECGGSDVSSGQISNPVVGSLSDFHITRGGTSIFSETVELIGTEKILAKRAKNNIVAEEITYTIKKAFSDAAARGADIHSVNPVPENIEGGLKTLEKKALGALFKTGEAEITGVLNYAETPKQNGLFFMDTPFFSTESMTAMTAAGAQLILFTTGVGNNIGSSISPTIKITGNPNTGNLMSEHIDVDISETAVQNKKLEDRVKILYEEVIAVCDGKLTSSEVLYEVDQAISRLEPSV